MCWGIFGNINEVGLIGTCTPAPRLESCLLEKWGEATLVCGRVGNFFCGGGGVGNLMGLRISEGKINLIPEKRQIRKPIIVCRCGLCVFKHRESTLRDKEAQACTQATCIFTHESQMCKSAEDQRN